MASEKEDFTGERERRKSIIHNNDVRKKKISSLQ